MLSASSLLAKVGRLKREAIAAQPVDPLACLSGDQRKYFDQWILRFHRENGGNAYSALIERKQWTPFEWLPVPIVTQDMSADEAGCLWNDFRNQGKM